MKVPISWFNDYVQIDIAPKEFGDKMTMSGSKVETIESLGDEITNVVVGEILSIEKHPDAEKLVITQVNVGNGNIQIVTGANNISVGDFVPIALHNSTLPGGIKIKKSKLRGIESNGMMCSIEELGLTREEYPEAPEHGIYILKKGEEHGKDIKDVLNLNDATVEFEITSNRPDCFGVIGLAREAAVTLRKDLKLPKPVVSEKAGGDIKDYLSVVIEANDLCPRYTARVIKNIKIEPSPEWMQDRLRKSGIRPINNIVDITNYVMLEYGQPMHAFDYDTIKDKKIIVRRAAENETIKTLDGNDRQLENSMLVIADKEKALAVAGVMGGLESEITENTTTLVFESANFEATTVRLGAKKLNMRTEASGRYEKGLDFYVVEAALNRAAELVEELNAGEVVKGIVDTYAVKPQKKVLDFEVEKINALLGISLSKAEMADILRRLEFEVDETNMKLTVPSFRPDVERMADVSEEILRFYGYDRISTTTLMDIGTQGRKNEKQQLEDEVRRILFASGLNEIVTYTFLGDKDYDKIGLAEGAVERKSVEILNPLGQDQKYMRTTMLPSMLSILALNFNRRNKQAHLFELSKVYIPVEGEELPLEKNNICIGMYGEVDFYRLKGIIDVISKELCIKISYAPIESFGFHPYRAASIVVGNKTIGILGEVHPEVLENYEITEKAYCATIDFDLLMEYCKNEKKYSPLPKFPAVTRDLAVIVKDEVLVGDIEKVIKKKAANILEEFNLFDVYKGKQIEEGSKSVAYTISFRAMDRTLTDEEINPVMKAIMEELELKLGAVLR